MIFDGIGKTILASLVLSGVVFADTRDEYRNWTNEAGRTISAKLSYVEGDAVHLILDDGRDASVSLQALGSADREFIADLQEQGLTYAILPMPEETKIAAMIEVKGGPVFYFTDHFKFSNTQSVSKGFVMEAGRVFEGTYEAVKSLPLGLSISPPGDSSHFQTSFLTQAEFIRLLSKDTAFGDDEDIAGIYMMKHKKVFVPYQQMGVQRNGSQLTLRKGSDTSTLIHEITHQLMHDWLPLSPVWLSEGVAEYMASIPYQNGRFEFRNAEKGLEERLIQRGTGSGGAIRLPKPEQFLVLKPGDWSGSSEDYSSALAYVYFFMHLDRPEAPGAPLAAYLRLLGEAKDETHRLITEYNGAVQSYNSEIESYNDSVVSFKKKYEMFQESAEAYNGRVGLYNSQVRKGVDRASRVSVGKQPSAPEAPKVPTVPEILENNRLDGPIDIFVAANQRAKPSLLRGRSFEELEKAMIGAFETIGLTVSFE